MKMKKWLAVLLAVLLACGAFPAGSFAEEKGLFQYKVQADGTAKITGINDVNIGILEIPAELDGYRVTAIDAFAFGHCGNLVSVTIPEGVTSIGRSAFGNCFKLEWVSIPDSLETIGTSAFRSKCLTDIVVSPDHPLFAVENEALINKKTGMLVRFLAPEITGTYEIAQGIRAIGPGAFELNQLSRLVIPDSVTTIGDEAMAYCHSLKELVIPDSVVSIGDRAFFRCTGMESIVIPDSVRKIGAGVFEECSVLTAINISPDHPLFEVIDLLLVSKADKKIIAASGAIEGKYMIPDGIRAIGDRAFRGCRNLVELFIPDTVTEIGQYPFNSDTFIRACAGSVAQKYCAVEKPDNFIEITPEEYAEEALKLRPEEPGAEPEEPAEAVPEEAGNNPEEPAEEAREPEQGKTDAEPAESADDAREEGFNSRASGMYRYEVLEDGTARIIRADESLTDGNIPAELDGYPVTSIGGRAFANCKSLQSAVIPEGVVFVGSFAFMNCTALESVSVPDSLTWIGPAAFGDAAALTDVRISPDHPVYEMIGTLLVDKQDMRIIAALNSTPALFEIPEGIKGIGDFAFWGSSRLTELTVPEGVTGIGESAFIACLRLRAVTLPASLKGIGEEAFRHIPDLLIKAPAGSWAEQYAGKNGYRFEALPAAAAAKEKNLFKYRVREDGTAEIGGIRDTGIEVMEIPAEVDGIPVTSIAFYAFDDCRNLVSVIIPEGVVSIDNGAFRSSYLLESVTLPDSLVSIGESAFRSRRLTDIRISPDHPVFAVENEALIDKRDMTLVRFLGPEITGTYEIEPGIRAIGPAAFEYNGNFTTLVIPDSVTAIGDFTMTNCGSMKEIVIPDSVVSIGNRAFYCCTGLESITIPDSVTWIGACVFDECTGLASISLSPDHPVYEVIDLLLVRKEDKAVIAASGAIRGSYAVPEEIRTIGERAFWGCRYLKELFIPDTVTAIGPYAFNRDTVVRACAGSAAQEHCAADVNIRFTEITPEEYAEEVRKLEQEKTDRESAEPVFSLKEDGETRVSGMYEYRMMPDGMTAEITRADKFLTDGNIPAELDGIPVASIGVRAFSGCAGLKSVVIPEGVGGIASYAFEDCTGLESVSIPDSLVYVDKNPFHNCPKLKTVGVSPDHPVFAAENRALVNRHDQTLICVLDREDTGTYTVAQGIRQIGALAFEKCRFSSILLPDSVISVGSLAFQDCVNLTGMVFPEGVAGIGSQVFYGCSKLGSVTFPDSVNRIGTAVFGGAPALRSVRISVNHPAYEMTGHLLVDKRNMEIVSALSWTPSVFAIPEGIRAVGDLAFQGSYALTELIVPEGVERIGWDAFTSSTRLQEITLPASMKEIREDAFQSFAGLLIKAPAGSWAEQYARENGYRFEAFPESAD